MVIMMQLKPGVLRKCYMARRYYDSINARSPIPGQWSQRNWNYYNCCLRKYGWMQILGPGGTRIRSQNVVFPRFMDLVQLSRRLMKLESLRF